MKKPTKPSIAARNHRQSIGAVDAYGLWGQRKVDGLEKMRGPDWPGSVRLGGLPASRLKLSAGFHAPGNDEDLLGN